MLAIFAVYRPVALFNEPSSPKVRSTNEPKTLKLMSVLISSAPIVSVNGDPAKATQLSPAVSPATPVPSGVPQTGTTGRTNPSSVKLRSSYSGLGVVKLSRKPATGNGPAGR